MVCSIDNTAIKSRLKWACRRGMLELDIILMTFLEQGYDSLNDEQQLQFERLLTCNDPELFAWFMGYNSCSDSQLAMLVALIKQQHHQ